MKKIINNLFGFVLLFGIFTNLTLAQYVSSYTYGDIDNNTNINNTCVNLTINMRLKAKDSSSSNQVTDLQEFLISRGYMGGEPTGYFGNSTFNAVKSYQNSKQILASGYVGDVTREKIRSDTCGTNSGPIACTMEQRYCPSGEIMQRDTNTCRWRDELCRNYNVNYSTSICNIGSTYSYSNTYPINKCTCPINSKEVSLSGNIYSGGTLYFRCDSIYNNTSSYNPNYNNTTYYTPAPITNVGYTYPNYDLTNSGYNSNVYYNNSTWYNTNNNTCTPYSYNYNSLYGTCGW